MKPQWVLKPQWRWLIFAVIMIWSAFWPFPRLELAEVRGITSFYYAIPSDRVFQVVYKAAGVERSVIRSFHVEGSGKIRLLKTVYAPPPLRLKQAFDPARMSRQEGKLIVQGEDSAFPALHLVIGKPGERLLEGIGGRSIDLSALFPQGTLVTLRVVRKPALEYLYLWFRR